MAKLCLYLTQALSTQSLCLIRPAVVAQMLEEFIYFYNLFLDDLHSANHTLPCRESTARKPGFLQPRIGHILI